MVVRDPFSRIASTFLDKYYLPDLWPNEVVDLLRRTKARSKDPPLTSPDINDFLRKDYEFILKTFGDEVDDTRCSCQ